MARQCGLGSLSDRGKAGAVSDRAGAEKRAGFRAKTAHPGERYM